MRTVTTIGGFETFISLHESEFLNKFNGESIQKEKLNERDQEIARLLTNRGILARHINEEGIYYVRDVNKGISTTREIINDRKRKAT